MATLEKKKKDALEYLERVQASGSGAGQVCSGNTAFHQLSYLMYGSITLHAGLVDETWNVWEAKVLSNCQANDALSQTWMSLKSCQRVHYWTKLISPSILLSLSDLLVLTLMQRTWSIANAHSRIHCTFAGLIGWVQTAVEHWIWPSTYECRRSAHLATQITESCVG